VKPARSTPQWLAASGLVAALLACYGTLALVGLLSVLGLSIALNPTAWAGAIVGFAGLGTLGVALGMRCHRHPAPTVLALLGFALIGWALFGRYDRTAEIAGFAALAAATALDWRARRRHWPVGRSPVPGPKPRLARHMSSPDT